MAVLWLLSLVTLFGYSLEQGLDRNQYHIIWRDEFDWLDNTKWQHEVTAAGGGVSILSIIIFLLIAIGSRQSCDCRVASHQSWIRVFASHCQSFSSHVSSHYSEVGRVNVTKSVLKILK